MPTTGTRKASTTAKGLGWSHQQDVARLFRALIDGTLCWWCGLPRYKDKARNWDGKTLAGDHSQPRASGGQRADRLLHGNCNSQRLDGKHDHVRPAVLAVHPLEWAKELAAQGLTSSTSAQPAVDLGRRLMAWP